MPSNEELCCVAESVLSLTFLSEISRLMVYTYSKPMEQTGCLAQWGELIVWESGLMLYLYWFALPNDQLSSWVLVVQYQKQEDRNIRLRSIQDGHSYMCCFVLRQWYKRKVATLKALNDVFVCVTHFRLHKTAIKQLCICCVVSYFLFHHVRRRSVGDFWWPFMIPLWWEAFCSQ